MDPGKFLLLPPPTEYGSRKMSATTPPPLNPFGQNSVCPPPNGCWPVRLWVVMNIYVSLRISQNKSASERTFSNWNNIGKALSVILSQWLNVSWTPSVVTPSFSRSQYVESCSSRPASILLLLSYIIVSYIQLSLLEPCSGQWPNFEEASFGWWSM